MFDNNFGKWTDFQFFFHQEICKKIIYVHMAKYFHLT